MSRNGSTTDEPTDKQAEYAKQVETVVADPDEIVKHLEKNIKLGDTLYDERNFRARNVKGDGPATLDAGVDPRDGGAYYDGKPHPIWLSPKTFVEGYGRGTENKRPHWPSRGETKRILRDERPELEQGTDEFTEALDEWHDQALDVWREEVRSRLKDEIELEFRFVDGAGLQEETITHTITVEYED